MDGKLQHYYGVILAAGFGSRIQPLSFNIPKPLLPVCNKPIIQHQIEYMREIGISRFLIVVHHLKEKLIHELGDGSQLGVEIKFIEQKVPLGIAHAIGVLEPHLDAPFLLFLGDIFIVPRKLERALELYIERKAAAILAVKKETNPEYIRRNYAVILNQYGVVKRVVEKPRYVDSDLKGCGIYFFDLSIFDAVRRTPRTAMRDEYEITSAIQILIDDGYPVYAAEVVEWDMNVTVPHDLLLCNLQELERLGEPNIIGDHVSIDAGATISNSIIGNDVRIEAPVSIENCVFFPNSNITSTSPLRNTIVTPGAMFTSTETYGVVR